MKKLILVIFSLIVFLLGIKGDIMAGNLSEATFTHWIAGDRCAPGASSGSLTNKASWDGSQASSSNLTEDIGLALYALYKTVYTAARSDGRISIILGGYNGNISRDTSDTFIEYINNANPLSNSLVYLQGKAPPFAYTGTIDDVSVKAVTIDDWVVVAGEGWNPDTAMTGKAQKTAGVASDLSQDLTTDIDDIYGYRLDFTTADRTAGNLIVDVGGTDSSAIITNAAQIVWLNGGAVDTNLRFEADAACDISVDAISGYRLTNAPPTGTAVWIQ